MLPFTLHQLRILKAIATEQNFTKASELLYLSQPSLSKQLKILEKNLDILLINRENNKISLTKNGKVFLDYSERILRLCEESCRALIDLKNKNIERSNLIVGASQNILTYLMPKVLTLFTKNYPQIDLKVQLNLTQIITKKIINREINIAFMGEEIYDKLKKNLTIKNLIEDEFSLIVSRSHPFVKKKIITKKDLYNLNFITLNSNSNSTIRNFMDNILIKNQIKIRQLKIIIQPNSIENIKTAVSLGLGAAFISSSAVKKEIKLKTIKILKIKHIHISRILAIITNPEYYKAKVFNFFYTDFSRVKNTKEN